MKSTIDEIKNRLLPSAIISRKVALKPRGNSEFIGLCPFHQEKSPSFSVVDDKGFFYCFGCGAKGDIFKFVMDTQSVNYNEALNILANEAGVIIPKKSAKLNEADKKRIIYEKIFEVTANHYHNQLINNDNNGAIAYLTNRGLTSETITKFRLGYASDNVKLLSVLKSQFNEEDIIASTVFQKNEHGNIYAFFRERILFPIFNRKHKIIAFGGRSQNEVQPKYLNSPDNPLFKKSHELYCFNFACSQLSSDRSIIVVEGYMDAIALFQAGFLNVVAPLGTAIKSSQIEMIWQLKATPILCLDNDTAGQRATLKICKEILPLISSDKTIKILPLIEAKDPDEFIQKKDKKAFEYLFNNSLPLSQYLFNTEKVLKIIKTPEQKSDFKKRLLKMINQINDLDLKTHYKSFFLDEFNKFIFSKKKANHSLSSELAINATMDYENLDVKTILNILANFPKLLANTELLWELEKIDIESTKLDKLRNNLLFVADYVIEVNRFNEIIFPTEINDIISNILKITNTNGIYKSENEDEAMHYLFRLFKLNRLNNLQREIETIVNELNNNPSESKFTLFTNLKRTQEQLKIELGII